MIITLDEKWLCDDFLISIFFPDLNGQILQLKVPAFTTLKLRGSARKYVNLCELNNINKIYLSWVKFVFSKKSTKNYKIFTVELRFT